MMLQPSDEGPPDPLILESIVADASMAANLPPVSHGAWLGDPDAVSESYLDALRAVDPFLARHEEVWASDPVTSQLPVKAAFLAGAVKYAKRGDHAAFEVLYWYYNKPIWSRLI